MFRSYLILMVLIIFQSSCDIPEDRVKTIIVVDELTKDKSYLSDNQIIKSNILEYDLQFRTYLPAGYENMEGLASIYLLDGQWFIQDGNMPKILDKLIEQEKIDPVIAIFVDSRNPHNLNQNRRNSEFLGNEAYINFLKDELVPLIDESYATSGSANDRALAGISFGAVGAAFGGLKASDTFQWIGCQSPAMHPVPEIYTAYENSEDLPLHFFLSTGTKNDKKADTEHFKQIFDDKDYDFIYREVPEGHSWKNWKPLLDDLLVYFFGE